MSGTPVLDASVNDAMVLDLPRERADAIDVAALVVSGELTGNWFKTGEVLEDVSDAKECVLEAMGRLRFSLGGVSN